MKQFKVTLLLLALLLFFVGCKKEEQGIVSTGDAQPFEEEFVFEPPLQLGDMDGFTVSSQVVIDRLKEHLKNTDFNYSAADELWNPETQARRVAFHQDLSLSFSSATDTGPVREVSLISAHPLPLDDLDPIHSEAGQVLVGLITAVHPLYSMEQAEEKQNHFFRSLTQSDDFPLFYSEVVDGIEYTYSDNGEFLSVTITKIS